MKLLLLLLPLALSGQTLLPIVGSAPSVAVTGNKSKMGFSYVTTSNSATKYANICGASVSYVAEQKIPVPTAGTFRKLYVQLLSDPDSGSSAKGYIFTLRKSTGGAFSDTAITTTILSSTAGFQNSYTSSDVHFNAGDMVELSIVPTGSPANSPRMGAMIEFQGDAANETIVMGNYNSLPATAGYVSLFGDITLQTTENLAYIIAPTAGTITSLSVYLSTVPGASNARAFGIDLNGSPTGSTISFGAANNGLQTAAQTIAVVAGDRIDLSSAVTGTPTISVAGWGIIFKATTAGEFMLPIPTAGVTSASLTRYVPMTGLAGYQFTEANAQSVASADFQLKGFTAYLTVDPGGSGKKYTLSLRRNAGAAGTTYSTDMTTQGPTTTVNTAYSIVADYDLFDTSVVPASTPAVTYVVVSYLGYIAP